ncbi:MAG: LysR family transcriptional regulator, partial [Polymorphobacter sp.]
MNLDWEKLRLFELVAEAGSFTEAARRLHMSQPAL